jgi:hypothetical protein
MTHILNEDDEGRPLLPEEDSLQALLRRATAASAEERRLKEARRRLAAISGSGHPAAAGESIGLLEEIRRLEEGRVWITHARVALFHTQTCLTCNSRHAFFMGWMLEQKHIHDKTARKLVAEHAAGKTLRLPERREDHFQGVSETCDNCVESVIAINIASGQAEEPK